VGHICCVIDGFGYLALVVHVKSFQSICVGGEPSSDLVSLAYLPRPITHSAACYSNQCLHTKPHCTSYLVQTANESVH